ncbi:hypothetical protein EPO05_03180 [Patescibacteria group bacterium]|nr:MAG: hypothetical protein EPO05_03180 [Patescibacteria group bacterium]
MKKIITTALATAGMVAFSLTALAASPVVSENANSNACFGQARASYAQHGPNGILAPNSNGFYISQRKGTNPENNAGYIALYCVAE